MPSQRGHWSINTGQKMELGAPEQMSSSAERTFSELSQTSRSMICSTVFDWTNFAHPSLPLALPVLTRERAVREDLVKYDVLDVLLRPMGRKP